MTYSRTFAESTTGDEPNLQVWRFVVNGDLRPSKQLVDQFGGIDCVVPPCFFDFNAFHVRGYIDDALDCDNGNFSIAYALDHDCDVFEHENAFTVRPGSYHAGISYTWVGPEGGFDCNPELVPSHGGLAGEGFRNFDFTQPLSDICQYEQPIETGAIFSQGSFCPCDDPDVYPGLETLHLEQGMTQYVDGCTGAESRPFFYGVQTNGGYRTMKITDGPNGAELLPISNQLIDLGNATLPPLGGAPHIGARSVPDWMIYLNVDPF